MSGQLLWRQYNLVEIKKFRSLGKHAWINNRDEVFTLWVNLCHPWQFGDLTVNMRAEGKYMLAQIIVTQFWRCERKKSEIINVKF